MTSPGEIKPILITNIGNRNLIFQGQNISDMVRTTPGSTFLSLTEYLFNQYQDDLADHFTLNILPPLLDAFQGAGGESVILYATNQEHSQDTLYAAKLIARLIPIRYPGMQVFVREIRCNVVQESEKLCAYYQSNIREALNNNPAQTFWIGDAGGTPQQQFALRLVSEMMIALPNRRMMYVSQQDGKSVLQEKIGNDFSTVILAEQMRTLIDLGKYSAATHLYRKAGANRTIEILLELAASRLTLRTPVVTVKAGLLDELPSWASWKDRRLYEVPPKWKPYFTDSTWSSSFELLSIAQYYLYIQDFTQFLFHAYLFHEQVTLTVLCRLWGLPDNIQFEKERRWLEEKLIAFQNIPDVEAFLARIRSERLSAGVVSFLAVAPFEPAIQDADLRQLINDFRSLNDYFNLELKAEKHQGWRVLRNRFAHDGRQISSEDIQNGCPGLISQFQQWLRWFEMPEENIYVAYNRMLIRRVGMAVQFA